ncbi:MAG: phosphate ABC transporter permease subunit PstC, partial [Anaerolineaceae bacterium]
MKPGSKRSEWLITILIQLMGYSSILFVALIFYFLLSEGLPAFGKVDMTSLFSVRWYPTESYFGILPLIFGSLIVTLVAMLIAVPFGIGTAVYISEVAPNWAKEILKP